MIDISPESPAQHAEAIEALYDRTFGPGHFAKTAERLREGNVSLPDISRVALFEGQVIGICRIWPIVIGKPAQPTLFIGPVAVDPSHQGGRLGLKVTEAALKAGQDAGWRAALIIGAPAYFGSLGFELAGPDQFQFPGPQDMGRVMTLSLAGTTHGLAGQVRVPIGPLDARPEAPSAR